jgi:dTDP-4-amino-4,6-dideoxygalactose transaminase
MAAGAGAVLVEDAAQAIGAAAAGVPVGSRSAAGCFSFYPTKNVGAAGDGGLVTTPDPDRATRIRRLRTHGAEPGGTLHFECGLNARMAELQAAFVNAKLDRLAEWTAARASAAERYARGLGSVAGDRLRLPPPAAPPAHVWHQYVVRIRDGRDRLRERLAERGIETRVFYPVPLHLQPCFSASGGGPGSLPVAERLASEVLSLPLYASIGAERIDAVCDAVAAALRA